MIRQPGRGSLRPGLLLAGEKPTHLRGPSQRVSLRQDLDRRHSPWTAGSRTTRPRFSGASFRWETPSLGDAWRFGFLDRGREHLTQDLRLYTVPDDLERLVGTLVAILAAEG